MIVDVSGLEDLAIVALVWDTGVDCIVLDIVDDDFEDPGGAVPPSVALVWGTGFEVPIRDVDTAGFDDCGGDVSATSALVYDNSRVDDDGSDDGCTETSWESSKSASTSLELSVSASSTRRSSALTRAVCPRPAYQTMPDINQFVRGAFCHGT